MTQPNFDDVAREIRIKIADGIFNKKWSSDDVDLKETELISQAIRKAVEDEREACAKVADRWCRSGSWPDCPKAIRSRGGKKEDK